MEDFKCSASWILSFRQRHNIGFGQLAGEGDMAGESTANVEWSDNREFEDDVPFCTSYNERITKFLLENS